MNETFETNLQKNPDNNLMAVLDRCAAKKNTTPVVSALHVHFSPQNEGTLDVEPE